MRRTLPLLAALAGLFLLACEPAPPVPGRTLIIGDSVTWQVEEIDGDSLDTADWLDARGVTAAHQFIIDGVTARTRDPQRSPAAAVYALGLNDASPDTGGWTAADQDAMGNLVNLLHADTCLVLVLPGVTAAVSPAYRTELNQARSFFLSVRTLRTAQGRATTVVDWQAVVDVNPGLVASDGVHLRADPAGVERSDPFAASIRRGWYEAGVEGC